MLVPPSSSGDKPKSVEYPSPLDLDALLMTLKGISVPPQHTQYITVMGGARITIKTTVLKKGKGNGRGQPLAQIHGISCWSGAVSKQAGMFVDSLSWVSSRSAAVASLCSTCWSLHLGFTLATPEGHWAGFCCWGSASRPFLAWALGPGFALG